MGAGAGLVGLLCIFLVSMAMIPWAFLWIAFEHFLRGRKKQALRLGIPSLLMVIAEVLILAFYP
jgi:hypothetical protein